MSGSWTAAKSAPASSFRVAAQSPAARQGGGHAEDGRPDERDIEQEVVRSSLIAAEQRLAARDRRVEIGAVARIEAGQEADRRSHCRPSRIGEGLPASARGDRVGERRHASLKLMLDRACAGHELGGIGERVAAVGDRNGAPHAVARCQEEILREGGRTRWHLRRGAPERARDVLGVLRELRRGLSHVGRELREACRELGGIGIGGR